MLGAFDAWLVCGQSLAHLLKHKLPDDFENKISFWRKRQTMELFFVAKGK